MALRLPHVLLGMSLVLAAGVASVFVLEARTGGASVPGVVVVEAPWLDAPALVALAGASLEIRGRAASAGVSSVPAGPEPLAPFDAALVRTLAGRGDVTALFSDHPELDARVAREAWRNVFDAFPAFAGNTASQRLVDEAAGFVRAQTGTRAFLAALAPDPELAAEQPPALAGLREALAVLPSYRRSSLVVLGAWAADGTRSVLRVDLGPWGRQSRTDLSDLLGAGW